MRRAVIASLFSAFMPGMGQIINRQLVKGGVFISIISLLFMLALGLSYYEVSHAILVIDQLNLVENKWILLNAQLISQGIGWLFVLLILYLMFLVWAVVDAWRCGQVRDNERGR